MDQQIENDHAFAQLAAAQLVELLKNMNETELEIPLKDSSGEWVVMAKLVRKN
jgi:hypothetical protein